MKDIIREILLQEAKKKKADDRCTRIAKRKYDVWPSAYASGAVVKCRQGKIWKNESEEDDFDVIISEEELFDEKWSKDYKKSINCSNPKGFSQRAHCQGKKKKAETKEATGAGSSGSYSQPAIWAKSTNKKDWAAARKTQIPGGQFVTVKKKCKKFPYCNQGDINALKLWEIGRAHV